MEISRLPRLPCSMTRTKRGKARNVHVGAMGVGDTPLRLAAVERLIEGRSIDEDTIAKADAAAVASVHPHGDIHGSAAYRRALTGTMVERALRMALRGEARLAPAKAQ